MLLEGHCARISLATGSVRSCGCHAADQSRVRWTKHGKFYNPLYRMWRAAQERAKLRGVPFTDNSKLADLPYNP